jgi:hypothetical protein
MAEDIKDVFISHIHEDDDGLVKLKELVAKSGLTVRDASINSTNPNNATDPDYIKAQILAPQIQRASSLVVYITPDTKNSEWSIGKSSTRKSWEAYRGRLRPRRERMRRPGSSGEICG